MAELSHKYILLQDRVGHIVERNILSLVLPTKQSTPTQVLRGELLEALPEAEQPNDSSKIALVGIDRKSLRLECSMDCIIRLTEEDANLLLAISSLGERYQTYMDRIRLDLGRKIGPGSKVYVTVKGVSKVLPGVVWYKGELLSCSGTMFGVELIDNPGQGTSDGTFRNKRYFTCPADSGVFVGLDKLTPRDDSISKSSKRAESHSSKIASKLKDSVLPSFLKGKNEENCVQGGFEDQEVEKMLKTDQRVVTFSENNRPLRGSVRFIGKDKDRNGKSRTIVGLELDTRDGQGTGKLHGRQVFVCKTDFALFERIEAVIPEENFDENPVNTKSRRTSEKVENVEEQIRKDELMAKSLSYDARSSGDLSSKRVRRASSVEDSASVIKAAGESSKTDPIEFMKHQQQLLDEIKSSKPSVRNDEDVVMHDDERTDSATKLDFDDQHFRNTPPITKQPGLSSALPGYSDYEVIDKREFENAIRQPRGSRDGMPADPGMNEYIRTPLAGEVAADPGMYGNTRAPLAGEVVTDYSPGTSHKPEVDMLSKEPTENLQGQNAMLYTEELASEKRTGAEGQTAVDVSYGFEVGSMVEVPMAEGNPRYGLIRWIGQLPQVKDKLVAGLELEEEQSASSDGTFNGMRYFTCPAGRGFFTLLQHCRQDSRFTTNSPNNDNSFHSDKAFGSLPSPDVTGITLPPKALEAKYRGTMHGIQGHHNSCYLDATLYSMFSFSSVFDTLLHREKRDTDLAEYDQVQRVLRESIVNPLRTTGFVRADRVLKLRKLLDQLSSTAGLVNEEKDPEEFLNSLLQQVLKADPFLHLKSRDARKSDSEGAFFYQIITEKDDTVKIAQVQQLLELSFISADIILSELPSCLILQMPRFGSKYKMYDMILPNLELDVTRIVENIPRECTMCGSEIARFECKDCQKKVFAEEIGIASYCTVCNSKVHSHRDRTGHRPRPVVPPRQFYSSKQTPDKPKMELFAVVCIETSHYVAFVKCGVGAKAPWCFFDSMADRKGEKNGYNIPEVSDCPEALEWLSKDPNEIVAAKERGEMPQKVRRLLGDGYLCMYQNLDMTMYK